MTTTTTPAASGQQQQLHTNNNNNNSEPKPSPARKQRRLLFPDKLWTMINDKRFESAIKWVQDGNSFVIFERELQNICLGKENELFHTKQPKSFVRQLHLYGFKKIDKNQFKHKYFRRARPELVEKIKRTYGLCGSGNKSTIVDRSPPATEHADHQTTHDPDTKLNTHHGDHHLNNNNNNNNNINYNWFDNDDQQHHLLEPINYYNEDGMSMYFNSDDDYTL